MVIQTADHYIRNRDLFHYLVGTAIEVAKKDYLVTLGITPTFHPLPSDIFSKVNAGRPTINILCMWPDVLWKNRTR